MNFTSEEKIGDMDLFTLKVDGSEFFHESITIRPELPAGAEFLVKVKTTNLQIEHPGKYSAEYMQQYGPYSVDVFASKCRALYASFADAERITDDTRMFIRKMWIFNQLFELFDVSFNLILVRICKLIPSIYDRAIKIMESESRQVDPRTKKYVDTAFAIIRKVYGRVMEVLAYTKFLKLLSPPLLEHFVKNSAPYMVARIKCLRWIEPEVVLLTEDKYNMYWTLLWYPFFKRNFEISSALCFMIAEYMPVKLLGETFLDYFRRKYDAYKGYFIEERAFEIEKKSVLRNGVYVCNVTLTFE